MNLTIDITLFTGLLVLSFAIYLLYLLKRQSNIGAEEKQIIQARELIMNSFLANLEYKSLINNVVNSFVNYLHFDLVVLLTVDDQSLKTIATAYPQVSQPVDQVSKLMLDQLSFPIIEEQQSPFTICFNQKKIQKAESFNNLVSPILTKEQADRMQLSFKLNGFLLVPIYHEEKSVGLLLLGSTKEIGSITPLQESNLLDLGKKVGYLLEHAQLYSSLQTAKESLAGMTKQIYEMNAKLHQLDKLKDDFVSVASHELRTPMTAVRSYVWMALNRSDVPLSEKLTKYLTRTLVSTERLINLVNDMLNVSRIESGRVEISPTAFNVLELIQECVAEVRPKAQEKRLQIDVVDTKLPKVFADPDKLHQVILNLIGNALKFTPAQGTITISFFSDGVNVETHIKDSGAGISKEDISHLFKKFGRLDNSYVASATSGGTGLGLYISKSLIDLMKGKVWASSEGVGKGATFSFSLPVATKENLQEAEKFTIKPREQVKGLEPVAI